jgi:translocation and assembly module TamB
MNKILTGKRILKKTLKILFGIIGGLVLLSIILSLTLLIPSVQTFVVDKATDILSKRAQSRVEVGGVHIAFPKTVRLSEIFAEDNAGDTLIYCKEIDIDVALWPLLRKKVQIDYLSITGLRAKVIRMPDEDLFNYSKLLAAFSSQPKENEKQPGAPWDIGFGDIELENIILDYHNHPDSTFLHLNLGHFLVEAREVDITTMKFDLDNITISQATFTMVMPDEKKSAVHENDTISSDFPEFSLKALTVPTISTLCSRLVVITLLLKPV